MSRIRQMTVPRPRHLLAASAVGLVVVVVAVALMTAPGGSGAAGIGSAPGTSGPIGVDVASPSGGPTLQSTRAATATPTAITGGPAFVPVDLFVTPSAAPKRGAQPTDPSYARDPRRPLPVQSGVWLQLKAAGRIALVDGKIVVLAVDANPMIVPSTGQPVPESRRLDVTWSRRIVEPYAYGRDARGNAFANLNYWNLCGPGAGAVALYYWQQLTGYPDVTGTEGYFLDPYEAEGVAWPKPGPSVAKSGKTRLGTYWSGSDKVNGFTAHGRGFLMYLAMVSQPPTWQSPGMAVFATSDGKPLYRTRGSSRANIQAVLNWEVSRHNADDWTEAWYASVLRPDSTLGRDLRTAVMLDIGRDGVPVIAAVDTADLPNWQAGANTPHTRHAIAIVGYDNTADPPTYTYLDTCGRACNRRAENGSGKVHVISQAAMVRAIQNEVGSGFIW
jgi:hypothetical protein